MQLNIRAQIPVSHFLNKMKLFSLMFPASSFWLCTLLLLTFNLCPNVIAASTSRNQTDHLALLKFKESISSDPHGILESWNSSTHFCKWHGITCSPANQRVTVLKLRGYQLQGPLSPHIGNLSLLRMLSLANNNFNGSIPQELGRLLRLRVLQLTNNSIAGEIPTNLTNCVNLEALGLGGNNLIGQILPIGFGSVRKLQYLQVETNNFTGGVPPFIGNLSSLTYLTMFGNKLEGHVPHEICHLKNLTVLYVDENKLSGSFPSCLYNMSSLTWFSYGFNEFNGSLPPNMFNTLPSIREFFISNNQITGPIPTSIVNASTLARLEIARNNFIGQVPSLGKLQDLMELQIFSNNLGNKSTNDLDFLKSLTNCSQLQLLDIAENNFGGPLPSSVGNLSLQLSYLYLDGNAISGKIPVELGNLVNLALLDIGSNHFEGTIPVTFGKFQKIQILYLRGNKVSGDIPTSIGNLIQLFQLDLAQNNLEGNIPVSLGNCQKLQYLDLSGNNLKGTIPVEVFSLSSLTSSLDLSHNSLSGSLPEEVGRLKNIDWLSVSENQLSGDIPITIGECMSLEYLFLQGNSFLGIIPSSLTSLRGLRYLDLSRNHLSGSIPKDLQNISLEYFNVSFNMLEGEVPTKGVFQNASALVVTGNKNLCGGISMLHLLPCPVKDMKHTKHHNFKLIAVAVSVVSFLLILSFIITIYWMRKRNQKPSSDSPTIDKLPKISYHDLHRGTGGFSARNFIGSGSFGCVYRGNIVSEDKDVAIKVLNLQKKGAHKSFIAECNALRNIRHRNLVKILTCCSSTDNKGQEFKALVFEYMKNGSLEQWLHPGSGSVELLGPLDLEQRLSIIIDVASALHYLHQECEQLVLHCDLKPSNVLLDDDMVAHVSDFGIARLVSTIDGTSHQQTSTIGIKGTVGYAPPEYGVGSEVSTCGDMYSFGILVLEMLTGRRPTDELFEDGQNLHKFVKKSFPDNLLQILDPHLVSRVEEATEGENNANSTPNTEKCLISLFRIGLACSMESPRERMETVGVIKELNMIKKPFLVGVPALVYAA